MCQLRWLVARDAKGVPRFLIRSVRAVRLHIRGFLFKSSISNGAWAAVYAGVYLCEVIERPGRACFDVVISSIFQSIMLANDDLSSCLIST